MEDVPMFLAIVIHRPELNGITIASQGYLYAFAHLTRQGVVDSETYVFGRPRAFNCDGLIAAVEIRSRDGGGFETTVTTGANYRKLLNHDGRYTIGDRARVQSLEDEVKP
jgi:hypothetical protein